MGYALIAPPEDEPLSREEVKLHLRIDSIQTEEDMLIGLLIVAARQYAEQKTGRSFVTQTWKYTMDSFPGQARGGVDWSQEFSIPGNAILLEKGPHLSIDGIGYVEMGGDTQSLASTEWIADLSAPLARITPRFGKVWPPTLPQIASAWVQFTAGYGDAEAVPQGIKQWMLLRIGSLYENREEVVSGRSVNVDPLPFVDSLLDPYTVWRA